MSRLRPSRRTLIKCGVFFLLAFIAYICFLFIDNNFDLNILQAISKIRNPVLNVIMHAFTMLGNVYGVIFVCLHSLLKKDPVKFTLPLTFTVLISWGLNEFIKDIVERARPSEPLRILIEHSFSFVSGHAMNNMALYLMAFLLLRKEYGSKKVWWLLLFPPIIAFSRLYFAVHYLTDVIAGLCIGVMVVMICYAITKHYFYKEEKVICKH